MENLGMNRSCFLSSQIGPIFQIIVLPFLLWFQIKPCKAPQIFLAHSFVHCSSAPNSLPIVIGCIGPPVSFRLYISNNHVFDLNGQPGYFPRNVGFPAAPRLAQVLQYGFSFVSFDPLGHHIWNVFNHRRSQLQIVLTLNSLFGHRLCDSFRMTSFKLAGQ